jgi:hypothetical protein
VFLALDARGYPLSRAEQRAHIMRPLQLLKLPGSASARAVQYEYSARVPLRFMFGFVAATSTRLTTAPAERRSRRWAECAMERVMRGRVNRVQVRLSPLWKRHNSYSFCAIAHERYVSDALCSKLWMIFRYVAPHRSRAVEYSASFHFVPQAVVKFCPYYDQTSRSRIKDKPSIFAALKSCDFELVWDHLAANASCVDHRFNKEWVGAVSTKRQRLILPFDERCNSYEPWIFACEFL